MSSSGDSRAPSAERAGSALWRARESPRRRAAPSTISRATAGAKSRPQARREDLRERRAAPVQPRARAPTATARPPGPRDLRRWRPIAARRRSGTPRSGAGAASESPAFPAPACGCRARAAEGGRRAPAVAAARTPHRRRRAAPRCEAASRAGARAAAPGPRALPPGGLARRSPVRPCGPAAFSRRRFSDADAHGVNREFRPWSERPPTESCRERRRY